MTTPGDLVEALADRQVLPELNRICEQNTTTIFEVLGRSRVMHVVDARRQCAAFLRAERRLSYSAIGKLLGRDSTSILHLLRPTQNVAAK